MKPSKEAISECRAAPGKNSSNPCNTCRLRHLRCRNPGGQHILDACLQHHLRKEVWLMFVRVTVGDENPVSCTNCRKSDVECVRSYNVRFRHALKSSSAKPQRLPGLKKRHYSFARDQPWMKTSRVLSFINETQEVLNLNESIVDITVGVPSSRVSGTESAPSSPSHPAASDYSPSPLASQPVSFSQGSHGPDSAPASHNQHSLQLDLESVGAATTSPASNEHQLASEGSSYQTRADILSFADRDALGYDALYGWPSVMDDAAGDDHTKLSPCQGVTVQATKVVVSGVYFDSPKWPLKDLEQAELLRHYVQEVAPMFDMCDSERHFAQVVPLRAATCAPLFNAVMAVSAKHLSRVRDFDPVVSDRYHQKCLKILIPALSDSVAITDENLLTAIVVLRFFEELDLPISYSARQSHLIGTRVILAAQEKICDFSGLRLAAYWLALRQEIYTAFVHARPVHHDFELRDSNWIHYGDSESTCNFTNRIIVHSAACLRFCYSVGEKGVSMWEELRVFQENWWRDRPWYFHPIWADDVPSNFFPKAMYMNDAVVVGLQYYHLSYILLAAHDPNMPRLGPGQVTAFRKTDENIKSTVRTICGIAESNPKTTPAYCNACIAIMMAGDRFTERHEQEALYRILVKIDTTLAWPSYSAQEDLKKAWGWHDSASPGLTGQ